MDLSVENLTPVGRQDEEENFLYKDEHYIYLLTAANYRDFFDYHKTEIFDNAGLPSEELAQEMAARKTEAYSRFQLNRINNLDGEVIEDIDTASFVHLGYDFYRDKNRLYVLTYKQRLWAIFELPTTVTILNSWYAYDQQFLYCGFRGTRRKIAGPLRSVPGHSLFCADEHHAYYLGTLIKDSHATSFESLDADYAKDDQHAYYRTKTIDGADPETFITLDLNDHVGLSFDAIDKHRGYSLGTEDISNDHIYDTERFFELYPGTESIYRWIKQSQTMPHSAEPQPLADGFSIMGKQVYFGDDQLLGVDADKFEYLKCGYYIYDQELYWQAPLTSGFNYLAPQKLSNVDLSSFHQLQDEYFSDGKKIICMGKVIRGVTPEQAEFYSDSLMKTPQSLYYKGKKLTKIANLEAFECLGQGYFNIDGQLYRQGRELKNCKSQKVSRENSFFISPCCIGLNNGRVIYRNKLQNKRIDAASLELLGRFAKDKNNVYAIDYDDRFCEIAGANPLSFTVMDGDKDRGQDDSGSYNWRDYIKDDD